MTSNLSYSFYSFSTNVVTKYNVLSIKLKFIKKINLKYKSRFFIKKITNSLFTLIMKF